MKKSKLATKENEKFQVDEWTVVYEYHAVEDLHCDLNDLNSLLQDSKSRLIEMAQPVPIDITFELLRMHVYEDHGVISFAFLPEITKVADTTVVIAS